MRTDHTMISNKFKMYNKAYIIIVQYYVNIIANFPPYQILAIRAVPYKCIGSNLLLSIMRADQPKTSEGKNIGNVTKAINGIIVTAPSTLISTITNTRWLGIHIVVGPCEVTCVAVSLLAEVSGVPT